MDELNERMKDGKRYKGVTKNKTCANSIKQNTKGVTRLLKPER